MKDILTEMRNNLQGIISRVGEAENQINNLEYKEAKNNKKEIRTTRRKRNLKKNEDSARFGSTYTKIGTIQRRLAWPLRKDDTQIPEAFHIF